MKPIDFQGTNVIVAENQPPYLPLPGVFVGGPVGVLLCCWELNEEELEEIIRTRRIYNSIMTFNQPLQPHCISADRPDLELFAEQVTAPPVKQEIWKVVKCDAKERHGDELVETNLTKESAAELANALNTNRATDSVHYFSARPA
jgi:hypothetical protein